MFGCWNDGNSVPGPADSEQQILAFIVLIVGLYFV